MNKRYLLILNVLFVAGMLRAQPVEYKVTRYDETKGMSSRIVRCIVQDRRGMMWFGTTDGLNCFDGYNFKVFRQDVSDTNSLRNNFISQLTADKDGVIWIGYLFGGVSSYSPGTGRFTHYGLRQDPKSPKRTPGVTMIHIDDHNEVWIGIVNEGLFKLDRKTGKCKHFDIVTRKNRFYTEDLRKAYNNVYAMHERRGGRFWLATHDGLYDFDPKKGEMLAVRSRPLEKQGAVRDDLFGYIQQDGPLLWLGSWAGGLSSYNTISGQWRNFKPDPENTKETSNIILGLQAVGRDTLWVNSIDKGLSYFSRKTLSFHFLGKENGFPEDNYKVMYRDKAGNFWMAAEKALWKVWMRNKKFVLNDFPVTHTDNSTHYVVSEIFENERFKMTGTWFADGLHVLDKRSGTTRIFPVEVLPGTENMQFVNDIFEDTRGRIWIVSRDFLYYYDEKQKKLVKPRQPSHANSGRHTSYLVGLTEDNSGKLWLNTSYNGLFEFDPVGETYIHFSPNRAGNGHIPVKRISTAAKDTDGSIWIGGSEGYMARFDFAQRKFVTVSTIDPRTGITANHVTSIVPGKNNTMWVGTYGGLFRYRTGGPQPVLEKVFTSQDGIKSDMVMDMCMGPDGKIWCITQTALCALNPATYSVVSYGLDDGLERSDIGDKLVPMQNGKMILTSFGGYYEFDPGALQTKYEVLKPVITSFKVNGQERFMEQDIKQNGKVTLPAGEGFFSFDFAAIDFNHADQQRYAYKLEGIDENWVFSGSRRYVGYTNIPGGNYVFKVKSTREADHWNIPETSIPIHIATVFYKTWWFAFLVFGSAAGSLYLVYRNRVRHRERIFSLERKAGLLEKEKVMVMYESLRQQLNPHFLFNSLTSLSGMIYAEDREKAGEFLEGLSKTYRYILKNSKSDLVPLFDEIRFAETYIKLQKDRFQDGLQVDIKVDKAYSSWKIAPVSIQNLLENAIKHNIIAIESPLMIEVFPKGDKLVVRNNIQKKNFVEASNRQGLAGMSSLYEYLSGRPIEIEESEFYFIVKIPLIADPN